MAIKRCPRCGTQYQLSAATCPDCEVELVEVLASEVDVDQDAPAVPATIGEAIDVRAGASSTRTATTVDRPTAPVSVAPDVLADEDDDDGEDGDGGDVADEQVTYEMGEWSSEARVMLEQLLTGAGIARVWEGTDLVVRAEDEEAVDDLVDEVRSTDEPMLDPDAEKVVYEVSDWTTEQLVTLTDGLVERGIGYQFDMEGELVVLATDEEGVEALLDVIEFGSGSDLGGIVSDDIDAEDVAEADIDGQPGDADDGLETAEILSDLFVACDRLQHNARDADGVLGVVNGAEKLAGRSLPFGYEPQVWESLVAAATGLSDDLAGDDALDEDLEATARALRDRLRLYV